MLLWTNIVNSRSGSKYSRRGVVVSDQSLMSGFVSLALIPTPRVLGSFPKDPSHHNTAEKYNLDDLEEKMRGAMEEAERSETGYSDHETDDKNKGDERVYVNAEGDTDDVRPFRW